MKLTIDVDLYASKSSNIALVALREACRLLLLECTPRQQELFGLMYPGGLEKMTQAQLCSAINQCQRTIVKNAIKASQEKLREDN